VLLCVSLVLVAIIGLVFGVLNFHRGLFFIATVEVVVFISCIMILLFVYLRPKYFSLSCIIFVVMSFTFGVIASGTKQADLTIFIWTGLGPLMAFFLLGARIGFFFSVFTVPLCVILFVDSHPNLPLVAYLNVIIFILWVVALSMYYEITRADTESALIRDIEERHKKEEELQQSEKRYRELSIVDDLTQLYNSRHFYFQLKIELERSKRYEQPLTLLLFDIDNFKAFNDTYGHIEGDHVLRRFGKVVKRCLREMDLAYRYGGEEFTILLPMTTSIDGSVTAERIRTEFKKENFSPVPGQEFHMTVSIGLAEYKPKEDIKTFVHRVDQLMYQAKKNGKDRVCSEVEL